MGPTWATPGGAFAVMRHPVHLRKTLTVALVVGTLLVLINQLDVLMRGDVTPLVWLKIALTYVVPFGVSNYGILVATHRR